MGAMPASVVDRSLEPDPGRGGTGPARILHEDRVAEAGSGFEVGIGKAPTFSVVIPVRPDLGRPAALAAVSRLHCPPGGLEVVIARGTSPAAQRNLAVQETEGEYLLFLDDDSEPDPALLETYLSVFRGDPRIWAVGGPALTKPGGFWQRVSALVLGEPLFMGKSASRYRRRGALRACDERELILCNLVVSREVFESVGGFDTDLYPNEENAFLERLQKRGGRVVYHPDAVVHRPGRETVPSFLKSVFGYGRGRAEQARRGVSRVTAIRIGLALAFGFAVLSTFFCARGKTQPATAIAGAYFLYWAVGALKLSLRAGPAQGLAASLLGALMQASYACGLLWGMMRGLPRRPGRRSLEKPLSYHGAFM
jgi:GT2 family glycosyltransferase